MSKNPLQEYHIQYRAGDTIFEQGDVGTEMFIVRSGMVKIYRNIEGKKESLAVLEKGDFFGEMAVLEGTPRSDNAEALEDVELVRIHSAVFDRMIRRNTEIAVRMILKLSRRVEEANGRLESFFQNASKSAPAQVPVIEEQPPPAPEPEVVVDAVPPDCLAALLLEGGRRVFPVKTESALIGRYDPVTGVRPEIDLTPVDVGRSVSRRHARILVRDSAFFLTEEVGALNGTYVKDRKVSSGIELPLEDGDAVRVGRVNLTFQLGKKD